METIKTVRRKYQFVNGESGDFLCPSSARDECSTCQDLLNAHTVGDYDFNLRRREDGAFFVFAGCREMTIEAYRHHVATVYPGTNKAGATLAILDDFEATIAALK